MYQRHPPAAEERAIAVDQARRQAIPRLLGLGLSVAAIGAALGLSIDEVEAFLRDRALSDGCVDFIQG